jgi:hypothetical protein
MAVFSFSFTVFTAIVYGSVSSIDRVGGTYSVAGVNSYRYVPISVVPVPSGVISFLSNAHTFYIHVTYTSDFGGIDVNDGFDECGGRISSGRHA